MHLSAHEVKIVENFGRWSVPSVARRRTGGIGHKARYDIASVLVTLSEDFRGRFEFIEPQNGRRDRSPDRTAHSLWRCRFRCIKS